MPSLLDIAPPELSAETIDIRGTQLKVGGIGADAWAVLYSRFPSLRSIVSGRQDEATGNPVSAMAAQLALVVAGARAGSPAEYADVTDSALEKHVRSTLTSEEQTEVMTAVIRLSMPGNVFGPLLDQAAEGAAAPSGVGPATK